MHKPVRMRLDVLNQVQHQKDQQPWLKLLPTEEKEVK